VIDTNFYGVVNVTRAALPTTLPSGLLEDSLSRSRKKWPLLVSRSALLEPAGMRTNWVARAKSYRPDLLPDHEPDGDAFWGIHKTLPCLYL
jgi:hypothetical protein